MGFGGMEISAWKKEDGKKTREILHAQRML